MSRKNNLEKNIIVLTNKLRNEKPAVYEHLTESPLTIPDRENEEGFIILLEKYEKYLKNLLEVREIKS